MHRTSAARPLFNNGKETPMSRRKTRSRLTASRSAASARRRFSLEALESRRVFAGYTLQILHSSDMEAGLAALQDAPRFAAVVDFLEDTQTNSILLSGGDNFLPGPFFNASGDPTVGTAVLGGAGNASIGRGDIAIMNRIGFEASAVGNHEFDLGTRELRNQFFPSGTWPGGLFPYLSSNVNYANEPDLSTRLSPGGLEANTIQGRFAPSAIITENGERIGIVGLTTPEIISISSPGPNLVVTPGNGTYNLPVLAQVVNQTVDALEAVGVNKVVLLSHLQQFNNEVNLAPLLSGVDVIIAAGSNTISADATDYLRPGDSIKAAYPVVRTNLDGNSTVIVSTDGGWRYVGRMVVTFDAAGNIDPASIDPNVSGAFATDDQGLVNLGLDPATALASGKGASVKQVTDALNSVIAAKDGNLFGQSDVFLEGRRAIVRTQETNLGNLTSDANLFAARQITGDLTIGISLKNGGGIRDGIGAVALDGTLLPPAANPAAGKQAGDISQLDIENSLRFNNGLSVVSLTGVELVRLLEHGFADSRPGNTPGRFPQVGGMTMEVDLSKPTGDRLVKLTATDVSGATVTVVQNGVVVAPAAQFRMVTLGFLADNGDSYPFNTLTAPNRVNLAAATGNMFTTSGSEQRALADFLQATFPVTGTAAFGQPETAARQDQRISLFPTPNDAIALASISSVSVPDGAEISAYDPGSKRLFVTKNASGIPSLDIINIANPASPALVGNVNLAAFGGSISSVAVKNGIVAAAMIANPKTNPGRVVFLNTDGVLRGNVAVGAVPDMITFTADGAKVLVAIEGEPAENLTPAVNNPEGGVSIITLDLSNVGGGSLSASTVAFAGFTAFNSQKDALIAAGVRLLRDPAVTVAMDLEPEFIALSPDGLTAHVTLQEANSVGILDLATNQFTAIRPLGFKDHNQVGNEFDASDRDGTGTGSSSLRIAGNLRRWPVLGAFMPDAIASFTVAGETFYVTANEGDARPNAADTLDTDLTRVGSIANASFDPAKFDTATVAFLKNEDNLGRLNVLTAPGDSDSNADGLIDRLVSLGARSFTIWNAAGARVFDSGAELERITFAQTPTMFNANNGVSSQFDQRSDDKGPEPEGVVTGVVNGRAYAFVGLERSAGGVMVYDVTNPREPIFVQYAFRNNLDNSTVGDDVSPEGLVFIPAAESPSGIPLLVVSNEVSGTVTLYQITPAPVINEFVFNHTGTDTQEFVEVLAAPLADLSEFYLLQVEGDNSGTAAGVIDSVHRLGAANASGYWTTGFLSDVFENGTATLLLVRGFTGAVGDDLDTNNDGVLDAAPWQSVIDAVAVTDGGSTDRAYTTFTLGTAFSGGSFAPGGASRIANGVDTNAAADWKLNDFDGEGLAGFNGTPVVGEVFNTPNAANVDFLPGPLLVATIPQIQGTSHLSPLRFAQVETSGIVTARLSNGFYLQTATPDALPATSEALFVFTGGAPTANIGDRATVRGVVHEFGFTGGLTTTRIGAASVTVTGTGAALPAATTIGRGGRVPPAMTIDDDRFAVFDPNNDGIDFYESLEGMLVRVNNAVAVSPTNSFGEIAIVADNGLDASARTLNGGVRIQSNDFNPERILIDDTIVVDEPVVKVGDSLGTVVGVIDYTFNNFKLFNTTPLTATPGVAARETTTLDASNARLRTATFNVLNLDGLDPQAKFDAVARDIVTGLKAPDIIGLQEVQDNNGPTNDGVTAANVTAQRLIDAIVAAGGPTYSYLDIAPANNTNGGEPGANIRPGFLYNATRTSLVAGSAALIDPANTAFVDSRKPLSAEFLFNGQRVTVINNHFNSKSGDGSLFGAIQPPVLSTEAQRLQQAQVVRNHVSNLVAANPQARVIVLGDLNDFEFSPPLNLLTSGGLLTNLVNTVPANERYTFNFDGNSQVLDHILVTGNLRPVARVDIVHLNADFSESARSSDHDPIVAEFLLSGVAVHEGTLFVVGTTQSDIITVSPFSTNGVRVSGRLGATPVISSNTGINRLVVLTDDGDDRVTVSSGVPTVLDGGRGNDNLVGGTNRNLLLGGDGNDSLFGGNARDILIGGRGLDIMNGLGGDDILIGGFTRHDADLARLINALEQWNSAASYSDRLATLDAVFSAATVFDDSDRDGMLGLTGRDWYFARVAVDRIFDRLADEVVSG
jgi:predicted extracellular nuclease/2',3'-cyclic-nucleotide 2'-phosphodiesterase (5'-nucleotidase family)